jgi:hypothetical protein
MKKQHLRVLTMLLGKFLTFTALLLGLNVMAVAADNDGCSDATLNGDYGFAILGDRLNADGTRSSVKAIAVTHFDGAGNLTQIDFGVTDGKPNPGNGNAQTGFHFRTGETGTYTVNPDCTGSAEIDLNVPVPSGSTGVIKLMLIVTNHGRAMHAIVAEITPPGATEPLLYTTRADAWKVGSDRDQDQTTPN